MRNYTWQGAYYSFDNYGLFKKTGIDSFPFDYTTASINAKWRFNDSISLLDSNGHVLESAAFNNRYGAKKYGLP